MSLATQDFILELMPGKHPPHVKATQYDAGTDGWKFAAHLRYNDEDFTVPSGYTATVEGSLESQGLAFRVNATIDGSVVSFSLDTGDLSHGGRWWAKILLKNGDSVLQTSGFVIDADPAGTQVGTVTGGKGFEEQIKDAVASVMDEKGIGIDKTLTVSGSAADAKVVGDAIKNNLASKYDPTLYYAAGNYVVHDNKLYRARAEIVPEAWNEAHWIRVSIAERVFELENAQIETDTTLTVQGAAADAKAVGDRLTVITDEIDAVEDATIAEHTESTTADVTYITFTSGYMTNLGEIGASANYQYTSPINVKSNEIYMSTSPDYALRYVTAFRNGVVIDTAGSIDNAHGYIVPENIDQIVITVYTAVGLPAIKKTTLNVVKENNLAEIVNAIKANTIYEDKVTTDITGTLTFRDGYVNTHGQIGADTTYKRTNRFPVSTGDVITTTGTSYPFRYVTAYIGDYPITEKSAESVFSYTVPEGVDSIVISIYAAQSTTEDTIKITKSNQYSSLFYGTLSQKNVGYFEKPYICLSCDDGADELATYTIPMIIAKGVPCTFGLYKTSPVFQHGYTQIVVDAVNNNNCEIAQHGGQHSWTGYNAEELVAFFDDEELFWKNIGVDVKSAIYPTHLSNPMVRAITGSRFGCCRSGYNYDGILYYDDESKPSGMLPYYGTGARSNLYAMSSWNMPAGKDLQFAKDCIDWAIANNKLIHFYWHDWDLDSVSKQVLEDAIDYAKTQDITFIKLSQVKTIT